ncbi:MAG TPA: hypothetical protein VFW37_10010 [Alphaproteobacteria bacterium]|nr:hypothetical protein [Alphaproteobacteria bacterium]
MTEILFDKISRLLELLVQTPNGEAQRGQLNLTSIYREDDDFILQGMGVLSGREHHFPLSRILEIIDVETSENVDIDEFRRELLDHMRA